MFRTVARAACAVGFLLGTTQSAAAQGFDLTLFVGRAFPTYDELLTLRPPTPVLPGIDISVDGSPLIKADGGPVFGGALGESKHPGASTAAPACGSADAWR